MSARLGWRRFNLNQCPHSHYVLYCAMLGHLVFEVAELRDVGCHLHAHEFNGGADGINPIIDAFELSYKSSNDATEFFQIPSCVSAHR